MSEINEGKLGENKIVMLGDEEVIELHEIVDDWDRATLIQAFVDLVGEEDSRLINFEKISTTQIEALLEIARKQNKVNKTAKNLIGKIMEAAAKNDELTGLEKTLFRKDVMTELLEAKNQEAGDTRLNEFLEKYWNK